MAAESSAEFRRRAVYLPDTDAVVLADVHLGRDRSSNVELPLGEFESVESRLLELLEEFRPAEVVVAGDALHSFSHVPASVADDLAALRDAVERARADFVLVEGNHDAMLESIEEPVDDHELPDGTVVCHGHEHPEREGERYLIGHEHPAIEIEGQRRPCFLWGPGAYRGADVIALPAFSELARGTRVNGLSGRDVHSPLLTTLRSFRPIVYDADAGEALTFPPLGDLQAHL